VPDYFVRTDKKNAVVYLVLFLRNAKSFAKWQLISLALQLLNQTRCGLGCVLGGELGENTTHAPAGFVRRTYRASIKEVAINCGRIGEACAGCI